MAFQAVPDTAQISHLFTQNGKSVLNAYYARHPGGYDESDLQALADKIDDAFAITFDEDMPPEVSYVKTEVRGLALPNDLVVEQNAGAGVGTHISRSMPNNVTFSIKQFSPFTGRSARGRVYWIGVPTSETTDADENFLKTAYATSIVADVDFIRASINAVGTWEAVLVSRIFEGAKRTTGVTFPWSGSTAVDERIDTRRGRLP